MCDAMLVIITGLHDIEKKIQKLTKLTKSCLLFVNNFYVFQLYCIMYSMFVNYPFYLMTLIMFMFSLYCLVLDIWDWPIYLMILIMVISHSCTGPIRLTRYNDVRFMQA